MKLKQKIAATYIATLSIAITGTTIGLMVGHYYQKKAIINRDAVVQQYALLNHLQVKILYNRPGKQLSPYLPYPEGFREAINAFMKRLDEIRNLLIEYEKLAQDTKTPELELLFSEYQETVAIFAERLNKFSIAVERLNFADNQIQAAQQELIELIQSPEFADFIGFPDQLTDVTNRTQEQLQLAELELAQSQNFRNYIATNSLLLSVAIASLAGMLLSRAIARQEIANQAERERLQLALESANILSWEWNPQTQQVYFDSRWKTILGYQDDEINDSLESWESRVHPEDIELVHEQIQKHIRGEIPIYENEHRLRCKDGSYRWNFARGKVVEWNQQGKPIRFIGINYDISDRKEAENKLRESQGIWRTLCDVTPAAIAMFDTQMRYLVANRAWYQQYGLENQEIIGRSHYEIFPDIPQRWKDIHSRCLTGVTEKSAADLWMRDDGGSDWVCWEIRPWIDGNGSIGGLLMYTEVITERKANEITLSELSKQLKKAQEVAHLGYWSFDITTPKISWSEEVFHIFGLDPDQGEPNFEQNLQLYHPEDRDFFLERVAEANQGIPQNFDARIIRPNGEIRYINSRIELEFRDGQLVRMFGIVIDISDRQTEEALRSLLTRTQLLNHISTEIRNSLNLDTILQNAVNAIFVELKVDICSFGWYNNHSDSTIWEVVKEQKKPEFASWIGHYQLTNFPRLFEMIIKEEFYSLDIRKSEDKEEVDFCQGMGITLYLALPIHTASKIGAFELGRSQGDEPWQDDEIDLLKNIANQVAIAIQQAQLYQESEAKSQEIQRAYRELQNTQIQLIQSEKMSSLGQLVAGVAHEINNPVSFIYGNLTHTCQYTDDLLSLLQLYQQSYPETPTHINDCIQDIDLDFIKEDLPKIINSMKTGAERIRDIVKSLRTFSRLDEAELKAVDLHENLESTLIILQNRLNGRAGNTPIEVIKDYGYLPHYECYIGLLNQVFMNLLANAIQAIEERKSHHKDPDYAGKITITTSLDLLAIFISIKDNGIGMSPEVQDKIFNPFFTTKPIGQGTGMGLPTSYQIITQNHRGELNFTSVLGEGSEFMIKLPLS
ncbi:histidine kinase [Arthrospira sp. PCC 8006]|uniref:PAS domain-containing protein n=1 Tax=Arthrospira sp. PCC 8006 TaxID=1982224 RepID=UPI00396D6F5D